MKKAILLLILSISAFNAFGQPKEKYISPEKSESIQKVKITPEGDSMTVVDMDYISVKSKRKFKSSKERRHYVVMQHHTSAVYAYAIDAIRVYRELEATAKDLSKRNRKKHVKRLENELAEKFKAPLKKLTRSEVKVLIKMIERELEMPMYEVVKDLKGGFSANYWNAFGKMYDLDIKKGYNPKDDSILELLLSGMKF
jgi:hypothetical protein